MHATLVNVSTQTNVAMPAKRKGRECPSHSVLVSRIARSVYRKYPSNVELDDLEQIGHIGLIEAVRNFVDRGEASFTTYATFRIRGAMIDHLRQSAFISRRGNQLRRDFGRTITKLQSLEGREPSDREVAKRLNLTVENYRLLLATTRAPSFESLDHQYSDRNSVFADDTPDPFQNLVRSDLLSRITESVTRLPTREALVVQLFFFEELPLEEIGSMLDISAARVCQIKRVALGKLKPGLAGLLADSIGKKVVRRRGSEYSSV